MFETAQPTAARIFAGLTFRLVLLGLVAALALNTYADFAIHGPLGLGFHFEGWKPKARRFQADLNAVLAAQAGAHAREVQQNRRVEAATTDHAREADSAQIETLARQLDAADRYIASHRLQARPAGSPLGATGEATAPGNPGLPPAMSADSLVAVSDADLRKCTADAVYAVGAHNWAAPLNGVIQRAAAADDER